MSTPSLEAPTVPFGSEQTDKNRWLPPEIVLAILAFLEDPDLVAASGVSQLWYQEAAKELRRRGKALYRWPHQPPLTASILCVVGERGLDRALSVCKGINTLELYCDLPTKLSSNTIRTAGEIDLEKLSLRNTILNSGNAKTLLKSNIPIVEVHTKRKKHLSRKSRKLLLDNKELFSGLVISNEQPHTSYHGIFTNPLVTNHCQRLDQSRVFLEAGGLASIELGDSLTCLRICNGCHLTERELLRLSALNLRDFAVSECRVPEEVWSSSFQAGFESLSYLSITDCPHLGLDTVRHISNKRHLRSLELDLRHLPEIDKCIFNLQESVSLMFLKLICVGASEFSENMFLEKKWKKLKKIVIINNSFWETNNEVLINLIDKYRQLNIVLSYHNNYTLLRSYFQLNKNVLSTITS